MKLYTRRQRDILRFISDYQSEQGLSPTLAEIGEKFGVHRVTIFQHMNALERKGAVKRSPRLARAIEILDPEFAPTQRLKIRGTISAGEPIETLEAPESLDPRDFLPPDGWHYALRVSGDSMIEDGIHDGDLVVVRRSSEARDGQVVVAVLAGEEATLKRFFREPGGRFRLEPANARLEPRVVDELEIRGIVVSVLRRL